MPAKLTKEIFVERSRKIHNDKYDYSKVNYTLCDVKVNIICPKHGDFWQRPLHHMRKIGCPVCKGELIGIRSKSCLPKFLDKVKKVAVHSNKFYDYSKFIYISSTYKGIIICPKHGEFLQCAADHLGGAGCPHCVTSKGEECIKLYLQQHNINFIQNYRIHTCRNKLPLPFDFYIPKLNCLIEYQGQQHYSGWNGSKKLLDYINGNDNIKKKFCIDNNILLYEIKYTEDIEEKLSTIFLRVRQVPDQCHPST